MSIYRIKLDQKRCIGCKACETHCIIKNSTPGGQRLGKLTIDGPKMGKTGLPVFSYKYAPCYHCEKAACVAACPSEALIVRESDGLVLFVKENCIGCRACIEACPFDHPGFDEDANHMLKCDLCVDRIDLGLVPACVEGCTGKALSFARKDLK